MENVKTNNDDAQEQHDSEKVLWDIEDYNLLLRICRLVDDAGLCYTRMVMWDIEKQSRKDSSLSDALCESCCDDVVELLDDADVSAVIIGNYAIIRDLDVAASGAICDEYCVVPLDRPIPRDVGEVDIIKCDFDCVLEVCPDVITPKTV